MIQRQNSLTFVLRISLTGTSLSQPLQAACEVHADYDVLEFLANKYPDAAKKRDHKGDLIIHSILSQGKEFIPRRKTVDLLLDLYPGSLSKATTDGACPLGAAFRAGQSTKIMERIIEKRHEQGISSFYIGEWNAYKMDAKDASRLCCELFPKLRLKTFHCDPASYTADGFICLMECISNDNLIEEFSVAFPKLDTKMSDAFLKVLRQNRTIRKLRLTRRDGMWSHDAGIDTLLQGTSLNSSLQTLCLSGLFLMSSFEFAFLVAKGPKKLILEDIMVENQWRSANSAKWVGSSVKNLTIRNCKMSGKCLDKMLASLVQLPVLKDLSLDFTGPEDSHDAKHLNGRDITTPIIGLLKHNWLKSLKVQGLNMEMRHLSVELGTNTSLKLLHMDALRNTISMNVQCLVAALIDDNRTLEEVKFHCDYKYDPDNGKTGQMKRSFDYVEDPAITFYTDRNKKENKRKPRGHLKEEKPNSLRHVQSLY